MQKNVIFVLCLVALFGVSLEARGGAEPLERSCVDADYSAPEPPDMWKCDMSVLKGGPNREGQSVDPPMSEWSLVEGLIERFKTFANQQETCTPGDPNLKELTLDLYISGESLVESRRFGPKTRIQFYGTYTDKTEKLRQKANRLALPVGGPAAAEVVANNDGDELEILEDNLAQLEFVTVPRFRPSREAPDSCFQVTSVSLVPSRVFDSVTDTEGEAASAAGMSLSSQKKALESLAAEANWMRRISAEKPRCEADSEDYQNEQISALALTLDSIFPEVEFIRKCIDFWRTVDRRVEQLREQDQVRMKELKDATLRHPETDR